MEDSLRQTNTRFIPLFLFHDKCKVNKNVVYVPVNRIVGVMPLGNSSVTEITLCLGIGIYETYSVRICGVNLVSYLNGNSFKYEMCDTVGQRYVFDGQILNKIQT